MLNFIRCSLKKIRFNCDSYLQYLWYTKPQNLKGINFILLLFLIPISLLYHAIIFFRHKLFQSKFCEKKISKNFFYRAICFFLKEQEKANIPVIVVGNITIGGTGKTPLVIFLAKFFKKNGLKPGIITRGYIPNRKNKEFCSNPHLVTAKDSADIIGDEATVIFKNVDCPIYVSPKRNLALKTLLAEGECDIVISDDGMQHYALPRAFEIAVIDGERLFGNGFCLPAGPLREPKSRLFSCDLIVVNGDTSYDPILSCFRIEKKKWVMQTKPQFFYNLKNPERTLSCEYFRHDIVHAAAGIGNPKRFFDLLRKFTASILEHPFPDHHNFSISDLYFGDEKPIIITEKDAIKCQNFDLKNIWVLKIETEIADNFGTFLLEKLRALSN